MRLLAAHLASCSYPYRFTNQLRCILSGMDGTFLRAHAVSIIFVYEAVIRASLFRFGDVWRRVRGLSPNRAYAAIETLNL